MMVADFFIIQLYKLQFRLAKKRWSIRHEKALKSIPLFPGLNQLDFRMMMFVLWILVGIVGAVLAQDILVSPVVLISMAGIGWAGYRADASKDYIKRRGHLVEILRLFQSNIETYQGLQESLRELYKQYLALDEKVKDEHFIHNLARLNELIPQGEEIEVLADRIFGSDKVYQDLSHAIFIMIRSGPANAVEYCKERIQKTAEWRRLVTMMNTEVGGIRLTALVLELLLVAGVFMTLTPHWGEMNSMFHEYFFMDNGKKLFLDVIMVAHTVVQFLFNEFLKSKSESI
jgi:hypothetical protein